MKNVILHRMARKTVHWLFVAVIVLYGITGYGITQYRIVEPATLGLLTKPWAFKIHDALVIPFLVLLALHIYQMVASKNR
jgi:cytochrome b subunit of formate dehydrogenase